MDTRIQSIKKIYLKCKYLDNKVVPLWKLNNSLYHLISLRRNTKIIVSLKTNFRPIQYISMLEVSTTISVFQKYSLHFIISQIIPAHTYLKRKLYFRGYKYKPIEFNLVLKYSIAYYHFIMEKMKKIENVSL